MNDTPDDRVGEPVPELIFEQSAADEVADELEFHLEMRTRELVARGMPPDTARRAAMEKFDDFGRVASECHHIAQQREQAMKRTRYVTNLVQDIQFAFRMLRKRATFAAMAVLPLALGIGAATAMYSVVDGVMLRPLPFPHPEQLVAIWATEDRWKNEAASAIAWNSVVIGQADYLALRDRSRTLSGVAAWGRAGGMLTTADVTESTGAVRVSASLFEVLGIRPVLGRAFHPGEDALGGPHVALLSWELWQRRFNGDSAVLGRSITFNDAPLTVVGIMPARVRLDRTTPPPGVWLPAFQGNEDKPSQHNRSYRGIGRLAAGNTAERANAEVAQIIADVKTSWKGSPDGTSGRVSGWQQDQVRPIRGSLLILSGAVALLLLIACVNVATLMFGEAARRQPEIAARTALGATPGRLARQLLTESLVIAGAGAVSGLAVGWALTKWLVAQAPANVPGLADVRLDSRVFLFTVICSVVTGIAFGLLPAFTLLRWGGHSAARIGVGQSARGEHRIQRTLVAAEVALSLVMLVGCSLLGRSLVRLTSVDPGFVSTGLIAVELTPPRKFWSDSAAVVAYNAAAMETLQSIPGVIAASGTNSVPFSQHNSSSPIKVVGRAGDTDGRPIQQRVVLSNYFKTTRTPILAGRDFATEDRASSERVAIISQAEARRDFPGETPVGRRVTWQGQDWTIIGVAGDVRYAQLSKEVEPIIYVADAQSPGELMSPLIRGADDGATLIRSIRQRIAAVNPAVVVSSVDLLPAMIEHSYAEERYRTLLGSLFGILGAVLAGIGMFGVISRTVARRMREAGIRLALGAPAGSLTGLMLRESAIGMGIGLAIGVPAAVWLSRSLTPYLFGVGSVDPVAYLLAIGLLGIAAVIATVPPARRAEKVDPVVVLRSE